MGFFRRRPLFIHHSLGYCSSLEGNRVSRPSRHSSAGAIPALHPAHPGVIRHAGLKRAQSSKSVSCLKQSCAECCRHPAASTWTSRLQKRPRGDDARIGLPGHANPYKYTLYTCLVFQRLEAGVRLRRRPAPHYIRGCFPLAEVSAAERHYVFRWRPFRNP